MEYSSNAEGHLDGIFTLRHKAHTGCMIRGRVFKDNDKIYLIIYRIRHCNVRFDIVEKIRDMLQKYSRQHVDFVIDDDGMKVEAELKQR